MMEIIEHLRVEAKSYDLEESCSCAFEGSRQDLLDYAANEIERLRSIVRINGLRHGATHADVDAMLNADKET